MKNTKLAKARLAACRKWPAATYAILSLIPVERRGLGTLAVDKHWRLYFDPEYLDSNTDETAALIVLHEVSHLLLRHHHRAGNATNWKLWNVATDCAVNYQLQQEGHDVPKDWCTPKKFQLPGNLTAEQYYHHLQEMADAQQQQPQPQNEAQDSQQAGEPPDEDPSEAENQQPGTSPPEQDSEEGDGSEGGEPQPGQDGEGTPGEDNTGSGSGTDANGGDPSTAPPGEGDVIGNGNGANGNVPPTCKLAPGESGSCSDGQLRPWEDPPPAKEGEGTPVVEEHEQEQLIRRVAEQIESKGTGKGHWSTFVQQILHPKIDPRVLLRMALRKALEQTTGGNDDTTYRRPSRRPSSGGCIRPSRVALVPKLRFIVDTSGSMSLHDLAIALGMIGKVLSSFRLRDGIEVMVGDTEVQSCDVIFDPKKIDCKGQGGTDMSKLLVEAAKMEPKPQLILIATDGYTSWPSTDIGIPVVACLTREATKRDVPKWIKTIVLV